MIRAIKAADRHFSDFGWLKTYWLFSFSTYYDPENASFGALRVFNDDVVEPGTGFPTHPHEEMEIITIVLQGEMTHEDSMGNKTVIKEGDVQRMSAGTGLTHSEFNLADKPVHFYQIWIFPDTKDLRPTYDQRTFSPETFQNRLVPVASGQDIPETVTFHTEGTIYRSALDSGMTVEHKSCALRRVLLYLTKGEIEINGKKIREKEQARIDEADDILIKAHRESAFVLVDVPSCKGYAKN
jgi:redox-sensitive bicupin YhaK (pirin superfamily)